MAELPHKNLHERNRASWNSATEAHNSHKRDQAAFFRAGGSTLRREERELLGDVAGRRIVHLQCNAGQDTLSLARLGATVTGVDISDEAIRFAQRLATESEIPATFVRADAYDWLEEAGQAGECFDVAFCSYGAICWLSDLAQWAKGIAKVLNPGGRFVTVEFHPMSMVFNERFELTYPYFGRGDPLRWDDGIGDYVAASGAALAPSGFENGVVDFKNPHPSFEFQWTLSDVVTALIDAGLTIDRLTEYPYSNGAKLFENMIEREHGRMYPPDDVPSLPLTFALGATLGHEPEA